MSLKVVLITSLGCLFLLFGLNSCQQRDPESADSNSLAGSKSAYLRLHANNPVDWQVWSEQAFDQAEREDKLVIISIGYVSCHWCHVMEEEVFSNDSLARKMNDHFVAIKVDREERPDIDKTYMNAALIINGSGGWPLNIIALPDGRPVFAGTYFAPEEWDRVLKLFTRLKEEDPEKLLRQAASVADGLKMIEIEGIRSGAVISADLLKLAGENLWQLADTINGGRIGAPKFPLPNALSFQLFLADATQNEKLSKHVLFTLDKMMAGGIYDHLAGGFFRYATDDQWKVPHFEKMLYDNAQLVSVYSEAYKLTGNASYSAVVKETLDFVHQEMTRDDDLFYASVDADSEGEEGKFYIWSENDIFSAGLNNPDLIASHFGIDDQKELDGRHVLYIDRSVEELEENQGKAADIRQSLEGDIRLMKAVRDVRNAPFHDDKVITSWNALMIIAYLDAYEALGDAKYLESATKALDRLISNSIRDQKVSHIPGQRFSYLEDVVFLSAALIKAYENTFDIAYLNLARTLTSEALMTFEDPNSALLFYNDPAEGNLIVNIHEITDNVLPGSNSQMAVNLFLLGQLYDDSRMIDRARKMLDLRSGELAESPYSNSNWGKLALLMDQDILEIAIVGSNAGNLRKSLVSHYLPAATFLGTSEKENLPLLENKYRNGETLIYVCRKKTCLLPVRDAGKALELTAKNRPAEGD